MMPLRILMVFSYSGLYWKLGTLTHPWLQAFMVHAAGERDSAGKDALPSEHLGPYRKLRAHVCSFH